MKKYILFGIVLTSIAILIISCNNTGKPSIWIKKDVISNFENAKYLRVNTETLATFNQETKKIFTLSEIDYVNDKFQMHSFSELDGKEVRQDYYRDGNTVYKNFNGTWQTEQVATPLEFGNSIDVINRLRSIDKMTYVKTEKLNYVDSYVLFSEVPEKEALKVVNGFFNNAIVGSSNNFVIKDAQAEWWINIDSKQLAMDIRTINAEIDGYPLQLILKNSYADYNEPLDIKIPDEVK
jgi:hypothetical protein